MVSNDGHVAAMHAGGDLSGGEAVDVNDKDARETDDLMTALQVSRAESPILSADGVVRFRLTRMPVTSIPGHQD